MQGLPDTPHPADNGADTQENGQAKGKKVSRKRLVNKLNLINFHDGSILINFIHPLFKQSYSRPAKPQPYRGDRLDCLWFARQPSEPQPDLLAFQVQNFFVPDGEKVLAVVPQDVSITTEGISFRLPETCQEISSRRFSRHPCDNIKVQMIQNSAVFQGALTDFSPTAFRVELVITPPQTFNWIDPDLPVTVLLSDSRETLYSGDCQIIRQVRTAGQRKHTCILAPLRKQFKRFRPKKHRSKRYRLVPSPDLCFRHPLIGKAVTLKITYLSGSGFEVEENEPLSVLLPGMFIPEAELSFANSLKIPCRTQVIHRSPAREKHGKRIIRVGLAILDTKIRDHSKLLGLLHQAGDGNSYLNNEVDLDSLWDFFFETGFIYPQKYVYLQARKEQLKETYRKIYTEHQDIARHFIYQENGQIFGHMAMVRFYRNSWLIHHHAARKSAHTRAGLMVLDQIGKSVNESYGLYSFHMNYLLCFFRPENRFPQRVFGGAVKSINDPKGCSLDSFAYFHFRQEHTGDWDLLPESWSLVEMHPTDLLDLKGFYDFESAGLMLQAFDLESERLDLDELSREYERIGLTRIRHLFSLKKSGQLKAIIVLNLTDIGLNLSDLTSCFKFLVVDPTDLPAEIVNLTLSLLSLKFSIEEISVLLFPRSYAEAQGIPSEKTYNLWVLNTEYLDQYFDHIHKMINVVHFPQGRK